MLAIGFTDNTTAQGVSTKESPMPIHAPRDVGSYRTGMTDPTPPRTGDTDFGLRLRRAREAARLTQAQVGAKIGREQNTISDYETGSVMPEAKDVPRLARAVGAEVGFLLEGIVGMPHEVERFLLKLPKRSWRIIGKLPPETAEQALLEIAALLDTKRQPVRPPKRRR